MALAVLYSRALSGFEAPPVNVEVHLAGGLPSFTIVGLPDTEVKEARDRVRAALQTSRFEFPARRITVNLAPAELPKEGGGFDLPIALGILAASGQVPGERLAEFEFVGELSLSGELRPVRGALAMTYRAARSGRRFVLPSANADEAALVRDADIRGADSLLAVCAHLSGEASLARHAHVERDPHLEYADLADVQGPGARQARARDRGRRRALAAADGPAGHRQDDARAAPARHAAADDGRRGARGGGGAVARRRRLRRAALAPAAVPRAASHRFGGGAGRRRRRPRGPARSRSRIAACCSSTSCPSSTATCSRCCASRSSRAASPSRAPRGRPSIPRASSSSRR